MPWNPDTYNQFKTIRYKPFFDLMDLISYEGLNRGVDIGCGTGEQTSLLSQKFEKSSFLGIDSSEEMLAESKKYVSENLHFEQSTIEDFAKTASTWDLIFSNAALQWSNDHAALFPALLSKLNPGGQFAVQMPMQKENLLNKILLDLVQEKPFVDYLHGWKRESPVLSIDEYAKILFENDLEEIQIMQKVFPVIAKDADELLNFISGTTLVPYLERLSEVEISLLLAEFKRRIENEFGNFPAFYAFKRLLMYGRKKS